MVAVEGADGDVHEATDGFGLGAGAAGEGVDDPKADVVPCASVLFAGVAETDDEPVGGEPWAGRSGLSAEWHGGSVAWVGRSPNQVGGEWRRIGRCRWWSSRRISCLGASMGRWC